MIWVGTSGYNYPEWRGTFYPEGFPAKEMFGLYAGGIVSAAVDGLRSAMAVMAKFAPVG